MRRLLLLLAACGSPPDAPLHPRRLPEREVPPCTGLRAVDRWSPEGTVVALAAAEGEAGALVVGAEPSWQPLGPDGHPSGPPVTLPSSGRTPARFAGSWWFPLDDGLWRLDEGPTRVGRWQAAIQAVAAGPGGLAVLAPAEGVVWLDATGAAVATRAFASRLPPASLGVLGEDAVVSTAFEGDVRRYPMEGPILRVAAPGHPSATIRADVIAAPLTTDGDRLWVPMPDGGLGRLGPEGWTAIDGPGAWQVTPFGPWIAAALGPDGVGLYDPAGPTLVHRCPLGDEIRQVIAIGDRLVVAGPGGVQVVEGP